MEGLHADVPKVINMSPTHTEEDFRNLNKRIECYGKKVRNLTFVKSQFLFYWDSVLEIYRGICLIIQEHDMFRDCRDIIRGFFGIINYDIF